MTTARDVIYAALEELGASAPGESVPMAHAERCRVTLNDMLDGWSNEDLMVYCYTTQTFSTVNGTAAYTIGPSGASITATRPLKVEQAWINLSDGTKLDLCLIEQRDYSLLNSTESGQPTHLFYDPQAPLGIVRLWLKPNAAYSVSLLSYQQFTSFDNLTDEVQLPAGYVAALKKNLAVEIAAFFGKNPLPVTVELASQYKGKLKSKNMRVEPVRFDRVLPGCGGYGSIYTGDY